MFLDDKLYNHTINREIKCPEDFQALVNELYKMTEDHWKPKFNPGMSYKSGKIEIDRVFNSWNLFIDRLKKKNYVFVDLLEKHSYPKAFMSNEILTEIYMKGK